MRNFGSETSVNKDNYMQKKTLLRQGLFSLVDLIEKKLIQDADPGQQHSAEPDKSKSIDIKTIFQ